jgi:DNA-binding MarR family transcriptional regulator
MSYAAMRWAIAQDGITSSEKLVLVVIADCDGCPIAYTSLANQTGLERKTVINCVRRLEELGLLVVARGGGRRRNLYTLASDRRPNGAHQECVR